MALTGTDLYFIFWGGASPKNDEIKRAVDHARELYEQDEHTSREACNEAAKLLSEGKFKE